MLRTRLPLVVMLVLAFLGLVACGAAGARISDTPAGQAAATAGPELAQIAAAPVPAGVDAATWDKLKAELVRVLEARDTAAVGATHGSPSSGSGGGSMPPSSEETLREDGRHAAAPTEDIAGDPWVAPTLRAVSSPPAGEGSVAQLFYNATNAMLSWGYACQGDYDQNGEVNIADLTPLAQHFGETSAGGVGQPFSPSSLGSVIDGDGNGEINIGDVTPIGMNFGARVTGYRIYCSERADAHPSDPDQPNGPGTAWLGSVALDASKPAQTRRQLNQQVVPTTTLQYYWVRPCDGAVDGAASNAVDVAVPPNSPPVASLSATGETATMAHIVWDASASHDLEGPIIKYEWDFDGDGVYEYDASAQAGSGGGVPPPNHAKQDYYYYDAGTYSVGVRVTDGGNLTATTTAQVAITQAATWHDVTPDPDGETPAMAWQGDHDPKLLAVDGRPAVVYTRHLPEHNDELQSDFTQAYLIASDASGTSWPEPQVIPGSTEYSNALVVSGLPAVLITRSVSYTAPPSQYTDEHWCIYLRAGNATGASWPTKKVLGDWRFRADNGELEGNGFSASQCLIVDGMPALFGGKYDSATSWHHVYLRASNPTGSAWPNVYQPLDLPLQTYAESYNVIGSLPSFISHTNGEDIQFTESEDVGCSSWAEPALVDRLEQTGDRSFLLDVSGIPAVVYHDRLLSALKYRRALNPQGSAWAEPVVLSPAVTDDFTAAVVDGRPTAMYRDRLDGQIKLIAANSASGQLWGNPSEIPSELQMQDWQQIVQSVPLVDVAGLPAFVYSDEPQLHYVAYY